MQWEKASRGRYSMNRDLNERMEGVSHMNVGGKRIPVTGAGCAKALRLEYSFPVTETQWELEHQEQVMRPELSVLEGDGGTDSWRGGWRRIADHVGLHVQGCWGGSQNNLCSLPLQLLLSSNSYPHSSHSVPVILLTVVSHITLCALRNSEPSGEPFTQ